jgi:hypothetical protein
VTAWTNDELDRIASAEELDIAPRRADGTLRRPVTIWVVRAGEDLYVRSWRGAEAGWHHAAHTTHEGRISAGGVEKDVTFEHTGEEPDDAVDAGYREKYGRYSGYVEPMVAPQARATTLRLVPRS